MMMVPQGHFTPHPDPLPSRGEGNQGLLQAQVNGKQTTIRLLKNGYFVILNEVKDLESTDMTRFFASLRMTIRRFR
jgi:hypothetical protein